MIERKGAFTFRNREMTVIGEDVKPGNIAAEFEVLDQDFMPFKGLEGTAGKVRIIAAVPSLETSVCDRETRRFNQEAANLSKDIAILVVSTDLPYTQKRWCGAAGIDQVTVVSDALSKDFGAKYGVVLKEVGVFRRAIFVVDKKDTIAYAAYMPALGDEPNYEEVLNAARKLV
ncbi:MAG TPA: thiol peroxidase [Bellilinea sp.]|nr:thiol peroxidase [Bellilinea sp.]